MNLQEAIIKIKEDYQKSERRNEEREVIDKFGYMFHPANLNNLTKEDFKSFLLIKNNKHWDGIHRQGNLITQDMDRLIKGLRNLLDENKPLKERLDFLFPKNKPLYIKGLGRAVVTPILMVVYPKKYGVYNSRTEEGLKKVGLQPEFSRGAGFSEKYIKVNEVLNNLAGEYNISLFELDEAWWKVTEGYKPIGIEEEQEKEAEELSLGFPLEEHLRRFLVDNWENLPLGKNYELLVEDGEVVGELYKTREVGEIDILARDRKTDDWVIIELKRGQSSDAVVGQTLRYMGWAQKNKVEKDEGVKGIIIIKEVDKKLESALFALKGKVNIRCFKYNVQFPLEEVTSC